MECTLSGHWDCEEDFRVIKQKTIVSRTTHICDECRRIIEKKEQYEIFVGVHDGHFYTSKTCKDCLSLRNAFYPSGGYLFSNIRSDIEDHIKWELAGEVDEKCIIPLTDKARDFIFNILEDVLEDD